MEVVNETAVLVTAAEASGGDRLLTFLTRGRGAVRLYARRFARRGKASPAAWHEPLQGGDLTYVRAREDAPGRLQEFQARRVWAGVRADFARTVHALAFLELLGPHLTEGEPQPDLFTLLVRFLDTLEREDRPELARAVATLRLLAISGFAPHLTSCVACGRPNASRAAEVFSAEAGGILCAACAPGRGGRAPLLSPAARAFMGRALALPGARAWRLRVGPAVAAEVSRVIERFHEERTGVRGRSGAFLAALGGSR